MFIENVEQLPFSPVNQRQIPYGESCRMPHGESWRIPYAYSPNGIHTVDLAHAATRIHTVDLALIHRTEGTTTTDLSLN